MSEDIPNYAATMSTCIDACQRCHHACLEAAQRIAATQALGSKVFDALVQCIGMTRLTAETLLTDQQSHGEICELCAKACKQCAELCKGTPELEACMKSCLECAHCCHLVGDQVAA